MKTTLVTVTETSLRDAAQLIHTGQVVAFPTETVYGLGANALDAQAVERIFQAKQRPADNPLIVHVHSVEQAKELCEWSEAAETLAKAFWPGPLTMVLPKQATLPEIVTAGLDSVGIRMPSHPDAQRFLRACKVPIAAPSANRSGRPSPTTSQHVLEDMDGLVPMILDGGRSPVGVESTVLDLLGEVPLVLRPGAVTPEQIAMVLGSCEVSDSVLRPLAPNEPALSPGMRHRHYAPEGRMTLVEGSPKRVAEAICERYDQEKRTRIMALSHNLHYYGLRRVDDLGPDAATAAQRLFYLLRELDHEKATRIYCETLPASGLGLAVMNRLARAAEFDVMHVGYDDK